MTIADTIEPKLKKREAEYAALLARQNETRKLFGLPPLALKERTCLACRKTFQSVASRTCSLACREGK